MQDKHWAILSSVPFVLLYFAFAIAPVLWIAINSFTSEAGGWSFANFQEIFSSDFYRQAIYFSIKLSFWSSLFGIVIAFIATYSLYAIGPSKIGNFILSFNTAIMNFTGVPLAFAFIVLIGSNGVFTLILRNLGMDSFLSSSNQAGVTLIYIYFQIPLAILLLYPAFNAIKDDWKDAAYLLGASRFNYWLKIVLPVLLPAILGTFVILFANALGAYATVYALNPSFNIIPIRIASLVSGDVFMDSYTASALSLMLLAIMMFITFIHRLLLKRYSYQ